jgi:hypothetical protein
VSVHASEAANQREVKSIRKDERFKHRSYVVSSQLVVNGPSQDIDLISDILGGPAERSAAEKQPCRAAWNTGEDLDGVMDAIELSLNLAMKIPLTSRVTLKSRCTFEIIVIISFVVELLLDEDDTLAVSSYGVGDLPYVSTDLLRQIAEVPARLWIYHEPCLSLEYLEAQKRRKR